MKGLLLKIQDWLHPLRERNPFIVEYNILIGPYKKGDKELFFGPLDRLDTFKEYAKEPRLTAVLRDLGIYSSISEAKGGGWDKPIPKGFSEIEIDKKHDHVRRLHKIFTLNQ